MLVRPVRSCSARVALACLLLCVGCGGGGGGGGTAAAPGGGGGGGADDADGPDAPPQFFDFQPDGAALQPGYLAVTPEDAYTPELGHGFTTAPEAALDGADHEWPVFGKTVTVAQAIPPSVLSDATIDCVSSQAGPIVFRADVAPGNWDVVVWLGDVTTPRHQVRASANGVELDVERLEVNAWRGSFDMAFYGNVVPLFGRVPAPDGVIELSVGSHPDGAAPITWTYLQDEDPNNPPTLKTATLVPAFSAAPLAALELHPARTLPLLWKNGQLAVGDAPADATLTTAVAQFNAGDVQSAAAGFLSLVGDELATARAAGLLWVAGHPAVWSHEIGLLEEAQARLFEVFAADPGDWPAARLELDVRRALDAERFRTLYGYESSGAPAAENLGRSCSLVEPFFPGDQPYGRKGRILWLRNRGGLDPRRVTVSWERAQWQAHQLEPEWGGSNPHVRLYARDDWSNDGLPWKTVDWGELAGPGPDWALDLVRNLNGWLDLCEWWAVHRQSSEGDIGGGWTDDVEILPAFGMLAYALEGASDVVESALVHFADGIWDSGVINTAAAYQAAYADVEHTAEATGNMLHVVPMLRFGDPVSIERILAGVKTFDSLFLTPAGGGHRHFRGNYLSATHIAVNPDHQLDIPLCARVVAPFAFALWHSGNPAVELPLREWVASWVDDAASTAGGGKPAGVFPHGVWAPTDTFGSPSKPGWWLPDQPAGQFYEFPDYHDLLYGLAGSFYLRTGDPAFRAPFDALRDLVAAWVLAGEPEPGDEPTPGAEGLWAGAKLAKPMIDPVTNLALASGLHDWDDYLAAYGTEYTQFRLDPTSVSAFPDLAAAADELITGWPYKTTEGVMTDRILENGWQDVLAYYVGAELVTAFKGMPVQAVTWSNTSRLFAAAVTVATSAEVAATTFLLQDSPRSVTLRCWQLQLGGDYVLRAGPASGLGQPLSSLDQWIPFHYGHLGDGPTFELPGRTTYGVEILQLAPPAAPVPLRPDPGLSADDVSYDADTGQLTVRVHNVGAAAAPGFTLRVVGGVDPSGPVLAETPVPALEAPLDLLPRRVEVTLPHDGSSPVTVVLDPAGTLDQITLDNDVVTAWLLGDGPAGFAPLLFDLSPDLVPAGQAVTLIGQHFLPDSVVILDLDAETPLPAAFVDEGTMVWTPPDGLVPGSLHLVSVAHPDGVTSNPLLIRVAL